MNFDPSVLELTQEQMTWLRALYELETNNKEYSYRSLRAALRDQLPDKFETKSIDSRILSGTLLTLLGMAIVDSNSDLLELTDKVVGHIAKALLDDTKRFDFRADDIASTIRVERKKVAKVLFCMSQIGRFYDSASGSGVTGELDSISVASEECVNKYLSYQGIESILTNVANRIAKKQAGYIDLGTISPAPSTVSLSFEPNTAFILMSMDPSKPELDDIRNAIKDICRQFSIAAIRVDEIEHSGVITEVILKRIQSLEFLIADVTWERPNVYYEIGYAHALGKRPIIVRKQGTPLHFDLSVHNIPEYRNITDLKEILRKRLEAVTGRMGPR